jgi:hypothetical protein
MSNETNECEEQKDAAATVPGQEIRISGGTLTGFSGQSASGTVTTAVVGVTDSNGVDSTGQSKESE